MRLYFRLVWRLLFGIACKLIVHGTGIMCGSERIERPLHSARMVHRVDTVNRELIVFVDGELLTFDVPVGCPVILHGEPVKLRMMQPRDRVKVTYARRGALLVALAIEVQPDEIVGHATRDPSGTDESVG